MTKPELLADAVRKAWSAMIGAFVRALPRGSRFTEETAAACTEPVITSDPVEEISECRPAGDPPHIGTSASAPSDLPTWWNEALALEKQDRLEEAEHVIWHGVAHLAFARETADMYRLRMLRMKNAGDAPGALAAFKKSSSFIFFYASMATSGGEGTALSKERDQFREQLVAEYGSDPEA